MILFYYIFDKKLPQSAPRAMSVGKLCIEIKVYTLYHIKNVIKSSKLHFLFYNYFSYKYILLWALGLLLTNLLLPTSYLSSPDVQLTVPGTRAFVQWKTTFTYINEYHSILKSHVTFHNLIIEHDYPHVTLEQFGNAENKSWIYS